MNEPGELDPALVAARRALLDAQEALEIPARGGHRRRGWRLSPFTGLTGRDHHATLAT